MRRQRFERHLAPEARVRREIHPSHAAAAQLPDDRVGAHDRSGQQDGLVGQKLGNALDDGFAQEGARALVMIEQREDFVADGRIVGSLPGGPRSALGGIAIERPPRKIVTDAAGAARAS